METVPGLTDALGVLARAGGVGLVLAFLFETAPFVSVWFQNLAVGTKWWIVFLLSLLLPMLAQLVVSFVPPDVLAALDPYWKSLAFGFLAWAGSQGSHIVFNKRLNGG